jgi:hypothetical protein
MTATKIKPPSFEGWSNLEKWMVLKGLVFLQASPQFIRADISHF